MRRTTITKTLAFIAATTVLHLTLRADDQTTAPPEWFPQSRTPEPNPSPDPSKPPVPNNRPFDSFGAFHQWAWQSFLWLTQDVGDDMLRFETFPTNHDVVRGKIAHPSAKRPMKLMLRSSKRNVPDAAFDAINQAGEDGILVAHNGRAVYYSVHLNRQMFQDIISKDWNDPTELNKERTVNALFEDGDMEIKVSWMIVDSPSDAPTMFVREALVDALFTDTDGKIKPAPHAAPLQVTVAMVGFHIAGWVKGHPEAIWATFEHNNNAPDFIANQDANKLVSERNWTFYTAGTTAADCNQLNGATLKLNAATQTLSPITQVARQHPFGMMADTPADDPNLKAITELNISVWEQLAPDSLWRNYFEVGAVWNKVPKGTPPIEPNQTLQKFITGSPLLSNTTIETFSQKIRSQNNCFSCHNTLMFNPADPSVPTLRGTNINTSHIITEAYLRNQPGK